MPISPWITDMLATMKQSELADLERDMTQALAPYAVDSPHGLAHLEDFEAVLAKWFGGLRTELTAEEIDDIIAHLAIQESPGDRVRAVTGVHQRVGTTLRNNLEAMYARAAESGYTQGVAAPRVSRPTFTRQPRYKGTPDLPGYQPRASRTRAFNPDDPGLPIPRGKIARVSAPPGLAAQQDRIQKYAKVNAGKMIDDLTAADQNRIGRAVAQGIRDNKTPAQIRNEILTQVNDEGMTKDRAQRIAVTETNRALSWGADQAARDLGATSKEWVTVGDNRVCPICDDNASEGPIEMSEKFPGSDTTTAPAHPNCRCFVAYQYEESGSEQPLMQDSIRLTPEEVLQDMEILRKSLWFDPTDGEPQPVMEDDVAVHNG